MIRAPIIPSLGRFKRGDAFGFYAKMVDEAGAPLTLDAAQLQSQVRDEAERLWADLTVAQHPDIVGTYLFTALPTVTVKWPLVTLFIDIQTDEAHSTDTFSVDVVKDVTRWIGG